MVDFDGQCCLWRLSSCRTFVVAALGLPTNLGVGQSWLFPASSIKLLTRRSLKSRWVYLAPREDNSIQLLSTVRSRRWQNNFVFHLKVDSSNSCWPCDQNCQHNPCASCTVPRCEVSWDGCCHHKNFLLLVVGPC